MQPLSIKISSVQLRDASIVSHLHRLLERQSITLGSFILEIAETARIGDTKQLIVVLYSGRCAREFLDLSCQFQLISSVQSTDGLS